jgi:hypothetical protein
MKRQYRGFPLWLPALLSRTALYFYLMSLTLFLLYVVGNFQHFSDGNLRLLMGIMDIYFYAFLVLSIGNIMVQIFFLGAEGRRHSVLYFLRIGWRMLLIIILYFAIKLLGALFGG